MLSAFFAIPEQIICGVQAQSGKTMREIKNGEDRKDVTLTGVRPTEKAFGQRAEQRRSLTEG